QTEVTGTRGRGAVSMKKSTQRSNGSRGLTRAVCWHRSATFRPPSAKHGLPACTQHPRTCNTQPSESPEHPGAIQWTARRVNNGIAQRIQLSGRVFMQRDDRDVIAEMLA